MQTVIYPIPPIDAKKGGTIRFSWNGNQIFKNRCIIKQNETGEIVYDHVMDSFKYEHPIDLSSVSLINGIRYHAFITVFDQNGTESDLQALGEPFLCLKTPEFSLTNLKEGAVISASSYDFPLHYSQEDGELLDSWSITIYNHSHTPLSSSGTNYHTETMHHTFSGFTNKNEYYVRAMGKTVHGQQLDTGFINFSVTYQIRDVFSLLEPTNIKETGAIQIRSNIVSSEGHPKEPVSFLNHEYVDLRNNELSYTEGFCLKEDFSYVEKFLAAKPNKVLAIFKGKDLTLTLTSRIGCYGSPNREFYLELKASSEQVSYMLYSNRIFPPKERDLLGVCLIRKNGLYHLELSNLKTLSESEVIL